MRCRQSMSPYSIETMAPGGLERCQASTRVLNPSHDSRPVSASRSCVALRASRRAKRPRRRTVNSSKLGSSGRLKMMSAPAGSAARDQRHRDELAGDLAAAGVLEFVGRDRLARFDRAARELVAGDAELLAREREVGFANGPRHARDSSRGNTAVAAVQPRRRQTARNTLSVLRSGDAPASSDLVSADFTGLSAACSISAVRREPED